jgi:hypothetical protein
MKRVCGNRLRQEARKYIDLQKHISTLEDQGYVSQIFDIIYEVKL